MTMPLAPPDAVAVGQPYYLYYEFIDFESGDLTDPVSLTLDITYGDEAGVVPDVAGPFTYAGTSVPTPDTIWRTGVGQYTFWWQVPVTGMVPGIYVATWTATYGGSGDEFLALENFPMLSAWPLTPVPAGDTGYWTGSLTYQPSWSPSVFSIPLGSVDDNGIAWVLQKVTGWDSPPSVGSVIQRSADHGGWAAAQYYGPRIITLTVMASAPTQALRDAARALMQQAVAIGTSSTDLTTFTYNEPIPKQAQVRRNGSAAVTETYPTMDDVIFTIPLVAPDPRKYAVQSQSAQIILPAPPDNPLTLPVTGPVVFPGGIPAGASSVTALNLGTFETRPQLTVTGPVQNPAIVSATLGEQISFTGLTLGTSDILTVDTDSRQALLNGSFYPADPYSAWFVLEPGPSVIYLAGQSTGGATLSLTWSSAWL